MKNYLFLSGFVLLLLLTFTLTSCENEDLSLIVTENSTSSFMSKTKSSSELYYEIIEITDLTEQILVVSALPPKQILELWKIKIEDFKSTSTLNNTQLQFLVNLESDLKVELFIENSTYRNSFDFDGKMAIAKNIFGLNEGQFLLTNVENIQHRSVRQPLELIDSGPNQTIESCSCTKNSDCTRLTGISLDGFSWEYGSCEASTCYRQSFLWWESKNNQTCKY